MKGSSRRRLEDLDLARAVALGAMLWAHWHPAAFVRIHWLAQLGWPLQVPSRLATPAFVTVFGLTMGARMARAAVSSRPATSDRRLARRVGLLFLSAIIVAAPAWVHLAWSGESSPMEYCFRLYSILLFYTLAVAFMIPASRILRETSPVWFVALGGAFWLVHEVLAFGFLSSQLAWPIGEWVRMVFISAQYAFFALMGWAFLMMPIGGWLWRRAEQGRNVESHWQLALLGLAMAGIGVINGVGWSELGLPQLREALLAQRYPPRIWFFSLFGGVTFMLTGCLGFLSQVTPRARPIWGTLGAIGRNSLPIYVLSLLIHPVLDLLEWWRGTPTRWGEPVVLLTFFLICAWMVRADLRKQSARSAKVATPAIEISPEDAILNRGPGDRLAQTS